MPGQYERSVWSSSITQQQLTRCGNGKMVNRKSGSDGNTDLIESESHAPRVLAKASLA
jgi:hypothetical protein